MREMSTHYECRACGHRYGYGDAPTHGEIAGHRRGCGGPVYSFEVVSGSGWAVVAPSGAQVATTEPGEPRAWAESYLRRLTAGGAVGYSIIER